MLREYFYTFSDPQLYYATYHGYVATFKFQHHQDKMSNLGEMASLPLHCSTAELTDYIFMFHSMLVWITLMLFYAPAFILLLWLKQSGLTGGTSFILYFCPHSNSYQDDFSPVMNVPQRPNWPKRQKACYAYGGFPVTLAPAGPLF